MSPKMTSVLPANGPVLRESPSSIYPTSLEAMAERTQAVLDAGRYQPADEQGLEGLARRYYMSGTLPDSYYPGKDVAPVPVPGHPGKTMAARWSDYAVESGISRAFIVMLFGAGLGVLPSLAIWVIHVINGRPCPSADFMWARMLAMGILRRDDFSIEASRTACKIVIGTRSRPVAERLVIEAKYEDFKHLHGKDNWKNHPEDMLVARAKSRAARRYAPDIFAGVYSADEMRTAREDAAVGTYEVPEDMMPDGAMPDLAPLVPATETPQEATTKPALSGKTMLALEARLATVSDSATAEDIAGLRADVEAYRAVSDIGFPRLVAAWGKNPMLGAWEPT
jgi:hypothetical protein